MMRFTLSGPALVALALFAFGGSAARAQDRTKDNRGESPERLATMMANCAKACSDCQRACDMGAHHCATMLAEGKKAHFDSLAACQDCAAICSATASIVARKGPFTIASCLACADCCSKCAKECERFPNDKHMKMCAEECRKCERECLMVKPKGGSN